MSSSLIARSLHKLFVQFFCLHDCPLNSQLLSKQLPGIVFARGGAVGILMLLECNNVKYAVLTEQVNAKHITFRHGLIWNKILQIFYLSCYCCSRMLVPVYNFAFKFGYGKCGLQAETVDEIRCYHILQLVGSYKLVYPVVYLNTETTSAMVL